MRIYDRLYKINKNKEKSSIIRLEKDELKFKVREVKTNNLIGVVYNLSDLDRFISSEKFYISNLSILKGSKVLKKYYFTNKIWGNILQNILFFNKLESFSIKKVEDLDLIMPKIAIMGRVLYSNPFYILVLDKGLNLRLITDVNLIINDSTDFNFEYTSIRKIYLSNIDFSTVTSLQRLFLNCCYTEEIYFKDIDTGRVEDFSQMFSNCINLRKVNISEISTNNAIFMTGMFLNCKSIRELDLNHFCVSSVLDYKNMFMGCLNLKELKIDKWCICLRSKCDNILMFCDNLDKLNTFVQIEDMNKNKEIKIKSINLSELERDIYKIEVAYYG